jgi:hypothetical protein
MRPNNPGRLGAGGMGLKNPGASGGVGPPWGGSTRGTVPPVDCVPPVGHARRQQYNLGLPMYSQTPTVANQSWGPGDSSGAPNADEGLATMCAPPVLGGRAPGISGPAGNTAPPSAHAPTQGPAGAAGLASTNLPAVVSKQNTAPASAHPPAWRPTGPTVRTQSTREMAASHGNRGDTSLTIRTIINKQSRPHHRPQNERAPQNALAREAAAGQNAGPRQQHGQCQALPNPGPVVQGLPALARAGGAILIQPPAGHGLPIQPQVGQGVGHGAARRGLGAPGGNDLGAMAAYGAHGGRDSGGHSGGGQQHACAQPEQIMDPFIWQMFWDCMILTCHYRMVMIVQSTWPLRRVCRKGHRRLRKLRRPRRQGTEAARRRREGRREGVRLGNRVVHPRGFRGTDQGLVRVPVLRTRHVLELRCQIVMMAPGVQSMYV